MAFYSSGRVGETHTHYTLFLLQIPKGDYSWNCSVVRPFSAFTLLSKSYSCVSENKHKTG